MDPSSINENSDDFTILKNSLIDNLKERKVYGKVEAQLRRSLFEGITGAGVNSGGSPSSSHTTKLMNELVREYLAFQGYGHALSCLEAEAGLQKSRKPRDVLANDLFLDEKLLPPQIPLLMAVSLKSLINHNKDLERESEKRGVVSQEKDQIHPFGRGTGEGGQDGDDGFYYTNI